MRHNEHASAVARGAALLDEKYPDWWKEINLNTLELDSCFKCTLGQLYGTYDTAFAKLNIKSYRDPKTWEYGFSLPSIAEDNIGARDRRWNELTNTWKHFILARRASATE